MEDIGKVKTEVIKALIKKAKGYTYEEECTEYSYDEDGEKKQKKRITTKVVPPDVSALKNAIELLEEQSKDVQELTDEELEREIRQIIDDLKN